MEKTLASAVYEIITGERTMFPSALPVENLFTKGSACDLLHADIWDAQMRLLDRLGAIDEDPDLEIILSSFWRMNRIIGEKMFYYGSIF